MDMRDAIISIQGTQSDPRTPFEAASRVELVTTGKYGFENGEACFSYEESDLTGMEGTRTTFFFGPGGVTMSREGSTNSMMHFRQGKQEYFLYETPFGATSMDVKTSHIDSRVDEHGGTMELAYQIAYNHSSYGDNHFKFHVKEVNNV